MEKRGRHFSPTGLIAGILAAGIVLSCAGCSSGQGTTDRTPFIESAPITAQPVETVGVPAEASGVVETAAPSDPAEPPPAQPSVVAEPSETAGGEAADMPQARKGLASLDAIDGTTMVYTGTHTVYNFQTSGYAGCGLDGTVKPFEMYYGVYAEADGTKITYRAYSHLEDVTPVSSRIKRPSTNKYVDLPIALTDNSFDMYRQANDTFVLTVNFSNGEACTIDLYANEGEPWIVSTSRYTVERTKELILDHYDIWYEVDMTTDINRQVYGEDTTDVTNANCTIAYGAFMPTMGANSLTKTISAGECIYTEAFAKGGK